MGEIILTASQLATFEFARGCGLKTPSATDIERTLEDLRQAQGTALIIGGMAVIRYGYERLTKDIDILYAHADGNILNRLDACFKIVLKAVNGWHHLEHRQTGVRLELIPEGGLTTYGFIPGPQTVGGADGFISLFGLVWLKLVSGRAKDDADIVEIAKQNMVTVADLRDKFHPELQDRFDAVIVRAKKEIENNPNRE